VWGTTRLTNTLPYAEVKGSIVFFGDLREGLFHCFVEYWHLYIDSYLESKANTQPYGDVVMARQVLNKQKKWEFAPCTTKICSKFIADPSSYR
jgi:hypothetical protein